jgi:hypothetical protein
MAVTLELILAMLLAAALFVGVKLEKRLKTLREDQAGFAKAVAELNGAVFRAEAGLAELKAATQDAQTTLLDRIQDAKGAAARLQQNITRAGESADRLQSAVERAAALPAHAPREEMGVLPLTTPVNDVRELMALSRRPTRPAEARPAAALSRADSLQARLTDPPTDALAAPLTRAPFERTGEPAAARSRARVDDDLFEAPEPPLRLAAGARR